MRRVVLVDDDTRLRHVVARFLRSCGFEVVGEACDGEDGILLVHQHQPDLIITDMLMPRRDGLSFVRALRSEGWDRPIIMMSGQPQPTFAADALTGGVNAYVRKPFEPDNLLSAIRLTLGPISRVA